MGVGKLGQLLAADESTFANISATMTLNLPVLEWEPSIAHDRLEDQAMQARAAVHGITHIGKRDWSLRFKMYWAGHGTTAAGALTQSPIQQLLLNALGGGSVANTGDTISGTASTANVINVTDGTRFTRGGFCRIGVKGDGKGDGQAVAISTIAANALTLLTNAPAAPTTAGHVVYATQMAFHDETLLSSLTTMRFLVMHPDTGHQHVLAGGQCSGIKLEHKDGELPTIEFTYQGAYSERTATSFPSATALGVRNCAPTAGGSFFINDVATATRATATPAEVEINIALGLAPIVGPGGAGTYQNITGWVRTGVDVRGRFRIPWVTTYETWWDTANQSIAQKHALFTCNANDGTAVGWYMPSFHPIGQRPSLGVIHNEATYVDVQVQATEGSDTTSALSRSSLRLFMG